MALVILAAAAAAWMLARRWSLRHRFGPEYDRLVAQREGRAAAERELRERERRHAGLDHKALSPEARDRFAAEWEEIQIRFVDDPVAAVTAADEFVGRLTAELGYPAGDYEEQLAYLSVEHARALGHYREAHEVHERNERDEASTEQLREALVHYRALITDLLGREPVSSRTNG
ncbi:hypothetical protein [Phytohabitans rumicis]|uniref:hypothetical protein n=1 Tax=Phytohabitans rumicis TaxID=1076125 RepID=UPI001FE46AF1|nr:hypothetical protein [Phytohabitans rumicis]